MSENKKDTIEPLYKRVGLCNRLLKIFICLNVVSALVESLTSFSFNWVLIIIEILSAIAVVVIKWLNNYIFLYEAEKERIIFAVSDGYSIPLSDKETERYYTNKEKPSLKKYAANIFESNYYSMYESGKMILPYVGKNIIITGIIIFAMIKTANLSFILAGVQGVFSASIIEDSISLIMYYFEMKTLYGLQRDSFLSAKEHADNSLTNEAIWIRNIVRYEVVKAYFKIQLDTKIYLKYRDEMNNAWNDIEKAIESKDM